MSSKYWSQLPNMFSTYTADHDISHWRGALFPLTHPQSSSSHAKLKLRKTLTLWVLEELPVRAKLENKHKQSGDRWQRAELWSWPWPGKSRPASQCWEGGRCGHTKAAYRIWSDSMKKKNSRVGQQGHNSPPPPRSVFLLILSLICLCLGTLQKQPPQRTLSLHRLWLPLFTHSFAGFNLISLFLCWLHGRGKASERCCFTYLRLCPQ